MIFFDTFFFSQSILSFKNQHKVELLVKKEKNENKIFEPGFIQSIDFLIESTGNFKINLFNIFILVITISFVVKFYSN